MTIDELKNLIKDYPGNFEVKFKTIDANEFKEIFIEDVSYEDKNTIGILVN